MAWISRFFTILIMFEVGVISLVLSATAAQLGSLGFLVIPAMIFAVPAAAIFAIEDDG